MNTTKTNFDKKIEQLSRAQRDYSSMSIYRVHSYLRNVNPKVYEPEIVAIGPYHRHVEGDHLQFMEHHKGRYLGFLLKRKKMQSTAEFVAAINRVESQARKCYAELPIKLGTTEFVQMLVLDGCFIIELLRKFDIPDQRERDDPIFLMDWIGSSLKRDLLLCENQVPYLVLCELYDLIEAPGQRWRLAYLLEDFFKAFCPKNSNITEVADNEIKHLLSLIRHCWIRTQFKDEMESEESEERLQFIKSATSNRTRLYEGDRVNRLIESATRLSAANVSFEKNEDAQLLDIKFEDGVMKMVPLTVEARTESLFRNLTAYEQYCYDDQDRYVSHYVKFLHCLIKSSKDVELLVHDKIIENRLENYDAVAKMVKSLNDSVAGPGYSFTYSKIFEKVNEHCEHRRNKWKGKLRLRINEWMGMLWRDYFNSPWKIISIVAALVLLLLTATQTVFTIL